MTTSTHQSSDSAISVRSVSVNYGAYTAVTDATFEIPAGKVMAFIGPNGAGKSTLLKAITGLQPCTGEINILGKPLDEVRRRIAYMPQSAEVDWDYPVTVEQVVEMGLYPDVGWFRRLQPAHRKRITEAMTRVGIEDLAKRQISELSGGQRRRVFVARVLAQAPEVYLLDEPFAGVDAASERVIRGVLHELRDAGATVVIVHHDLSTIREFCDSVTVVNRRVVASGPVSESFTRDIVNEAFGLGLL